MTPSLCPRKQAGFEIRIVWQPGIACRFEEATALMRWRTRRAVVEGNYGRHDQFRRHRRRLHRAGRRRRADVPAGGHEHLRQLADLKRRQTGTP